MSLATFGGATSVRGRDCLAVLNEVIGARVLDASKRVIVSPDARSPQEGLALVGAYVSIADRRVRQALLDALLAIAADDQAAKT